MSGGTGSEQDGTVGMGTATAMTMSEADAFSKELKKYDEDIYQYTMYKCWYKDDVEEVFQETLMALWKWFIKQWSNKVDADQIDILKRFFPMAKTIVKCKVFDLARKRKLWKDALPALVANQAERACLPAVQDWSQEELEQLFNDVEVLVNTPGFLTDFQREVAVAHLADDNIRLVTLAKAMGRTRDSVKSAWAEARRKIYHALLDSYGDRYVSTGGGYGRFKRSKPKSAEGEPGDG